MELQFSVADTGIGIAPERQRAIFDAFSQEDPSTARRFGGTGLGLSICSSLVRLMDGEIRVESQPGQGSTFHFTARVERHQVSEEEPDEQRLAHLDGLRALILDDNPTNCRILRDMLAAYGLRTSMASEIAPARLALRQASRDGDPFHVVLCDLNLGEGQSGIAFVEWMRRQPAHAEMPVVLLSSGSAGADGATASRLGISARLLKPVKQSDLVRTIASIVDAPASPAGVPEAPISDSARPLNVLVAEDNTVNQSLIRTLLERQGHRVTLAPDGLEAVAAWQRGAFDLVLMDVQMPGMDGLTATEAIRREEAERGDHTPIVALTAQALQEETDRCLAAGMDDCVTKPFRHERLMAVIRRVVGPDRAVAPATPRRPPLSKISC